MEASKNELYVTGSILVSLRPGDCIGNVVGVPAGNKTSSPTARPTLSPAERVQEGKISRSENVTTLFVLSIGYECLELYLRSPYACMEYNIKIFEQNSQQSTLILR